MKRPKKADYGYKDYWISQALRLLYYNALEKYCDWLENELKKKESS